MINETIIKSFLEVARTLNFSSAGNNLYISQQAISKHIASLEEDLRLSLFTRNKNHTVTLTQEGEDLAKLLLSFDIQFKETLKNLHERVRIDNKHLNIGIQSMHNVGDIPSQTIAALSKNNPDLTVTAEMHSAGELLNRLDAGLIDFVTISDIYLFEHSAFNVIRLRKSPVYLVASKKITTKINRPCFNDFCSLPLYMTEADYKNSIESKCPDFYQIYGFRPEKVIVRPNWDSVYINIEVGNGVTIATHFNALNNLDVDIFDSGTESYLIGVWQKNALSPIPGNYAKELKKLFDKADM